MKDIVRIFDNDGSRIIPYVKLSAGFKLRAGACVTFSVVPGSLVSFQDPSIEPLGVEGIRVRFSKEMPPITLVFPIAARRRTLSADSCDDGHEIRVGEEQQRPIDICGCSASCMDNFVMCTVGVSGTYAPVKISNTVCEEHQVETAMADRVSAAVGTAVAFGIGTHGRTY